MGMFDNVMSSLSSWEGGSSPINLNSFRSGKGSTAAQRQGLVPGLDSALTGRGNTLNTGQMIGLPGADSGGGIFGGLFDNFLSSTNNATGITTQGWGDVAAGGLGSIFDMYSGMKQFGLAQDQFDEGKRQYDQNYQAQVKNYNADLEDRQRARVASNAGAYQSVSDYMKKNRQV